MTNPVTPAAMPPRTGTEKRDVTAEDFTAAHPVGTWCIYHSVRGRGGVHTRIRSAAWTLGHGQVVVAIEGRAGGVSVDHLDFWPAGATG